MFTYTKRELRLLALSLTLFVLLIYNLVLSPFINSILNLNTTKIYSNYVYSKTIPIKEKYQTFEISECIPNVYKSIIQKSENTKEIINEKNEETKSDIQKQEKIQKTNSVKQHIQRDVVKENQNIKWRIKIPKIDLDIHIMEGTTSSVLLKAVGHFEETSKWQGNVGLAAHNRGYQCNFFAKIKNLKIGDEIIYTTTNGKKVYKIQTNKVIKDTDWSYLQKTNDNRITLITCEENRESYRRCVQAIEIANYKIEKGF